MVIEDLTTKRRLAHFLGVNASDLEDLRSDNYYHVYDIKSGHKKRRVEEPVGVLKKAHSVIFKKLKLQELPYWLFSSSKGKSHISNGAFHVQAETNVLKIDMKGFYPSCKVKYVFRLFNRKYCLPDDIAWILSDILTYDKHIPTGSPSSQLLAFLSYHDCFDEIHRFSTAKGVKMSLYVDDFIFSSEQPIQNIFLPKIIEILNRYELNINPQKTKKYTSQEYKKITGTVISPKGELLVPNSLRLKIQQEKMAKNDNKNRLNGLMGEARRIEPDFGTLKRVVIA